MDMCKNYGHLYRDRVLGGRVVRCCAHCGTIEPEGSK